MARSRLRILITAGPTREYLDPVRFLSNPSSGRMGYLIARLCARRGWKVHLVSGPVSLPAPPGAHLWPVETSEEMRRTVMRLLPRVDAVVMAAAVTDWKPAVRARAKIKRKEGWNLHLVPTRDILAEVCRRRKASQYIIGFALETHRMVLHGVEKFRNKGADCIIANTPAFFGSGRSGKAAIILHDRVRLLSRTTKARVAAQVVGLIARQLARHRTARRN